MIGLSVRVLDGQYSTPKQIISSSDVCAIVNSYSLQCSLQYLGSLCVSRTLLNHHLSNRIPLPLHNHTISGSCVRVFVFCLHIHRRCHNLCFYSTKLPCRSEFHSFSYCGHCLYSIKSTITETVCVIGRRFLAIVLIKPTRRDFNLIFQLEHFNFIAPRVS